MQEYETDVGGNENVNSYNQVVEEKIMKKQSVNLGGLGNKDGKEYVSG